MTTRKPQMLLWLSDARGVYIPRDFAKSFADRAKSVSGVSEEDWAILEAGPESCSNESYWDVWNDVEQNAVVTDEKGVKYTLYNDGDCWLVPEGMEWNEETDSYDWPDERETDDEKLWFSSSSGRIELQMTLEQAQSASHQGQCDDDVLALSRVPEIKSQLDAIDPHLLASELKEYGAWDESALADHDQNIQRLLWLAAGDIVEENREG